MTTVLAITIRPHESAEPTNIYRSFSLTQDVPLTRALEVSTALYPSVTVQAVCPAQYEAQLKQAAEDYLAGAGRGQQFVVELGLVEYHGYEWDASGLRRANITLMSYDTATGEFWVNPQFYTLLDHRNAVIRSSVHGDIAVLVPVHTPRRERYPHNIYDWSHRMARQTDASHLSSVASEVVEEEALEHLDHHHYEDFSYDVTEAGREAVAYRVRHEAEIVLDREVRRRFAPLLHNAGTVTPMPGSYSPHIYAVPLDALDTRSVEAKYRKLTGALEGLDPVACAEEARPEILQEVADWLDNMDGYTLYCDFFSCSYEHEDEDEDWDSEDEEPVRVGVDARFFGTESSVPTLDITSHDEL